LDLTNLGDQPCILSRYYQRSSLRPSVRCVWRVTLSCLAGLGREKTTPSLMSAAATIDSTSDTPPTEEAAIRKGLVILDVTSVLAHLLGMVRYLLDFCFTSNLFGRLVHLPPQPRTTHQI